MLTDVAPAGTPRAGSADDDAVELAQAALEAITSFFDEAIREDVAALRAARNALNAIGPDGAALRVLRARAESLEVQGTLYGMPLLGALAGSLQKLVSHAPATYALPLDLVDAHIDALGALTAGRRPADAESAIAVRELRRGVRQTLAEWSRAEA